ncbi:uncharacterized protein LOC119325958 [Triticum dicoccoides]|uniref:uncharacterized protein LOC119325958 n=1 Tax=Triticum dicoccoides TaxID=85692 RepID=UPI00189084C8|nr:uncharacterized protein LOC119325958 [Triticum dicoccoides]XP_037455582.1 uncharacterized protein LOC119325958 [Triticum dicoccoides]XP_037455585.1 uncharacterized protein LOC119325958 [Triticum dicoccoides]
MSTPTSSRLGEQQDRGGPAISGRGQGCFLSMTKTKKQNTPAKLQHKTLMRKEFCKMAKSVKNQLWVNVVILFYLDALYPHNRAHGCNGKKIMVVCIIKHTTEIIDLLTDGEGFQMLKEEDNRNFCDVLSSIFFSLL